MVQTKNTFTSAQAVASKMVDKFHVEMDIWQVSENCMEALNRMGMLKNSRKAIVAPVKDQVLQMPVGAYDIIGVFRQPKAHEVLTNSVTLTIQDITFPPQKIFVPIPNSDSELQEIELTEEQANYIPHMAGPYIDFDYSDPPFLKFNELALNVIVLYNSIPIDRDTGLCRIPEAAFNGCLYFCLYTYFQPLFLMGKVQMGIWNEIKEWKDRNFNQSRQTLMYQKLSQNEMSKVHNVMASMDRKRYKLDS